MPLPKLPYADAYPAKLEQGFVIDECCTQLQQDYATAGAIGRLLNLPEPVSGITELLSRLPFLVPWSREVHLKMGDGTTRHSERIYPPLAVLILAYEAGASIDLKQSLAIWVMTEATGRARNSRYGGLPN